jgi:hypothetical protein
MPDQRRLSIKGFGSTGLCRCLPMSEGIVTHIPHLALNPSREMKLFIEPVNDLWRCTSLIFIHVVDSQRVFFPSSRRSASSGLNMWRVQIIAQVSRSCVGDHDILLGVDFYDAWGTSLFGFSCSQSDSRLLVEKAVR